VCSYTSVPPYSFKVSYLTLLLEYCMTDAVNAYLSGSNEVQSSERSGRTGWTGERWTPTGCAHTSDTGQTGISAECA
jgi:hypothetical protein